MQNSFPHYGDYAAIKRERFFFNFATTFTLPWSIDFFFIFCCYVHHGMIKRKKLFSFSHYVHYATIKRKKLFSISALHSLRHGHKKKKLIFIPQLPWLRYDHEKNILFFISLRRSLCKYLLTSHYVTNLF